MIDEAHPGMTISRKCELIGLSRSSYYYEPRPESVFNLAVMRRIDEQFLRTPFYGVPRMTAWLRREGYLVNPKRVRRLMRLMGLDAVYPKRWLSQPDDGHRVFPYLLRDVKPQRPDHVWATDITYICLAQGFVYLVAILDWFSRYVVSWELSNTLDTNFCVSALTRALKGARPAIFNTDQGAQFTSVAFTEVLQDAGVRISMDGRGRFFDNIFVERLWRTVKYEEVYLHDYRTVRDARTGLSRYFRFYNFERLHESLGYHPPHEVYVTQGAVSPKQRKPAWAPCPAAVAGGS
jgi:putative transposase